MKISEAAGAAGLDVSSVRFYERKGLINPDRGEDSNYRDYTSEDIRRLKKIVLFRKIDMSIEDIKKILIEDRDANEILYLQMEKLEQDKQKIEGSIKLCRKMMDEGYKDEDTDKYIAYVSEEESKGQRFSDLLPVLDQISLNSGVEKIVGYPLFISLMSSTVSRRLLAVAIFIGMVLFPITELVLSVIKLLNGRGSLFVTVIWVFYTFMLVSFFVNMMGIRAKISQRKRKESTL